MKFELLGQSENNVIVPWILNMSKVYGILFDPQDNVLIGKEEKIVALMDRGRKHFIYLNDEWDELEFPYLVKNISDCCCPATEDNTSIIFQTPTDEYRILLKNILFIKPEYIKSGPGGFYPTILIQMVENKSERIRIDSNYMDPMKYIHKQLEQAQKFPGKQTVISINV